MSVNEQINRIHQAKTDIQNALNDKGISVPTTTKIDEISPYIENAIVGDMKKSVYDTNNNGIVDNAETLGGYTLSEIMLLLYPVGSIKFSTENVNPSTYIGGTWVAWGQGRVPVGVDTSDSDFNTPEETGGAKTNSHYHIEAIGNDGTAIYVKQATIAESVVTTGQRAAISVTGSKAPARYSYTSTSNVDILPPYITC